MKSELSVGMVIVDDYRVHFLITKTGIPYCHVRNMETGTNVRILTKRMRIFKLIGKNYKGKV